MLINNSGITANSNSTKQKEVNSAAEKDVSHSSSTPATKDNVELSERAKELSRMETQLASSGDVDVNRVETIRSAIENGSYQIDPDSIATKMLDSDALG